jgi:hypothetical protein
MDPREKEKYYGYIKDFLLNFYNNKNFDHLIKNEVEFKDEFPIENLKILNFKDGNHIFIYFTKHHTLGALGVIFKLPRDDDKDYVAVYNNNNSVFSQYARNTNVEQFEKEIKVILDPLYLSKLITEYYEYTKEYFMTHNEYFVDIHTEAEFLEKLPKNRTRIYSFTDNEHIVIYFIGDPPEYKTVGLLFRLSDKKPITVYNNFVFENTRKFENSREYKKEKMKSLYNEFVSYLFPEPKKELISHITKKDQKYNNDFRKLSKKIADSVNIDGTTTDEIDREVARLYTINPKPMASIIKEYGLTGYKNYILEKCKNLFYHEPHEQVFIAVDDDKTIWCYSEEEWKKNESGKYNPYNLKNSRRIISTTPVSDNSVIISPEAYNSLKFWTELTYTMGKIYYNVSEEIAQEFAKTLRKDEYFLYRGMTFEYEEDHVKFLSKNKCGEKKRSDNDEWGWGESQCEIEFKTFTSWSYDYSVALNFARKFKRGVVVKHLFSYKQLLVDITKVDDSIFKDRLRYKSEREVVALPFKGTVTVADYDPTDHVEQIRRRRTDEDEDSFEVTEFSEDEGDIPSPPPGFE